MAHAKHHDLVIEWSLLCSYIIDFIHPEGKLPVMEEEVFDIEESEPDIASDGDTIPGPDSDVSNIVSDQTCIAYTSNILTALRDIPLPSCSYPLCSSSPQIQWKIVGTAMTVKWVR